MTCFHTQLGPASLSFLGDELVSVFWNVVHSDSCSKRTTPCESSLPCVLSQRVGSQHITVSGAFGFATWDRRRPKRFGSLDRHSKAMEGVLVGVGWDK